MMEYKNQQEKSQGEKKLSLDKFNFPKEWSFPKNHINNGIDGEYIQQCFNEAIECSLFKKDDKKHFAYVHSILSCCTWFYPKYNYDQLMVASSVMQWIFVVDDFLERDFIDGVLQESIVKRYEDILIFGENSPLIGNGELTPVDKYTLVLRNRLLKSTENRIESFDIFIHYLIDWFMSIIPLKKSRGTDGGTAVEYQVYTFIRNVNIGVYFLLGINSIAYDLKIDGSFWLNPLFNRMKKSISKQITVYNDCVSYAKEVYAGCGGENCLYFLQNGLNKSIDQVYELLVLEANQSIEDFKKDEILLFDLLVSRNYSNDYINGVKLLVESLKEMLVGNRDWSIETKRYVHSNSPFDEKLGSDPLVVAYDTILNPKLF